MRIGVISDTHGKLHPRAVELFTGVDHILHAGDIGGEGILEELRQLAPVTAVAGNVDNWKCGDAGLEARITIGGLRFYVTHIFPGDMPDADVFVFGHSHLPHNEKIDGVWLFNPASAGPRRFDYPVSVGFFEKRGGTWRAWHEPLDARSAAALKKRMNQLDLRTRTGSSSRRRAD